MRIHGRMEFSERTGVIDANSSVRGWLSGFQAGYNYQVNWLVLGVEGEFTWSRVRSGFPCVDVGDQVCSADPEWVGTLAGRIGAAFGPALFYVKGGAAWVHDSYSNIATCSGNQSRGDISAFCGDLFVASETRPGWIVGVGAEYRFMPNWSVKVEYDYLRFGERSIFFRDDEGNFFSELIRQDMHMVKVGVNYRFGEWDSAPLSAYANAAPGPSRRSRSSSKPTSSTDDDDDESSHKILASTGLDVGKYTLDGWVSGLLAPWNDLNTSGPRVMSHLKFGSVEVDVTAGYAKDSTVGTGAFGIIELSTPLN